MLTVHNNTQSQVFSVTLTGEYPVTVSYPAGCSRTIWCFYPLVFSASRVFISPFGSDPPKRYGKGAAERIIRRGFPLGSARVTVVQFSHANGQPLLGVRATRIYSASQFRIRKCRASVLRVSNFRSTFRNSLLSRNWHRSLKKTAFSSLRAEGVPSHETSCSGSRKSTYVLNPKNPCAFCVVWAANAARLMPRRFAMNAAVSRMNAGSQRLVRFGAGAK
jgi:hypothetical protein